MNTKERIEWTTAVGACVPGADVKAMLSAAEALDGPGRWEVSVSGGGLHRVGLRFFGAGDHAAFLKAARKAFALDAAGPSAPAGGFPWLSAAWDVKTGRWTALRLCGAARGAALKPGQALAWDHKPEGGAPLRRLLRPVAFKPGIFREPALDRALEDFARLSPLSSLSVEDPGWGLRLERPLRWPMFARCDLSAAFTPGSAQRALFLLDRSVTELAFDGEALWAHCAG
jgi:hypothetical protein